MARDDLHFDAHLTIRNEIQNKIGELLNGDDFLKILENETESISNFLSEEVHKSGQRVEQQFVRYYNDYLRETSRYIESALRTKQKAAPNSLGKDLASAVLSEINGVGLTSLRKKNESQFSKLLTREQQKNFSKFVSQGFKEGKDIVPALDKMVKGTEAEMLKSAQEIFGQISDSALQAAQNYADSFLKAMQSARKSSHAFRDQFKPLIGTPLKKALQQSADYGKMLTGALGAGSDRRGNFTAAEKIRKNWNSYSNGGQRSQEFTSFRNSILESLLNSKSDFKVDYVTSKDWGNNTTAARITPKTGGAPFFLPVSLIDNGRSMVGPTGKVISNDIILRGDKGTNPKFASMAENLYNAVANYVFWQKEKGLGLSSSSLKKIISNNLGNAYYGEDYRATNDTMKKMVEETVSDMYSHNNVRTAPQLNFRPYLQELWNSLTSEERASIGDKQQFTHNFSNIAAILSQRDKVISRGGNVWETIETAISSKEGRALLGILDKRGVKNDLEKTLSGLGLSLYASSNNAASKGRLAFRGSSILPNFGDSREETQLQRYEAVLLHPEKHKSRNKSFWPQEKLRRVVGDMFSSRDQLSDPVFNLFTGAYVTDKPLDQAFNKLFSDYNNNAKQRGKLQEQLREYFPEEDFKEILTREQEQLIRYTLGKSLREGQSLFMGDVQNLAVKHPSSKQFGKAQFEQQMAKIAPHLIESDGSFKAGTNLETLQKQAALALAGKTLEDIDNNLENVKVRDFTNEKGEKLYEAVIESVIGLQGDTKGLGSKRTAISTLPQIIRDRLPRNLRGLDILYGDEGIKTQDWNSRLARSLQYWAIQSPDKFEQLLSKKGSPVGKAGDNTPFVWDSNSGLIRQQPAFTFFSQQQRTEAESALSSVFGKGALNYVASPLNLAYQSEWSAPKTTELWETSIERTFQKAISELERGNASAEEIGGIKSLRKKIEKQTGISEGVGREWAGDLGALAHAVLYSNNPNYQVSDSSAYGISREVKDNAHHLFLQLQEKIEGTQRMGVLRYSKDQKEWSDLIENIYDEKYKSPIRGTQGEILNYPETLDYAIEQAISRLPESFSHLTLPLEKELSLYQDKYQGKGKERTRIPLRNITIPFAGAQTLYNPLDQSAHYFPGGFSLSKVLTGNSLKAEISEQEAINLYLEMLKENSSGSIRDKFFKQEIGRQGEFELIKGMTPFVGAPKTPADWALHTIQNFSFRQNPEVLREKASHFKASELRDLLGEIVGAETAIGGIPVKNLQDKKLLAQSYVNAITPGTALYEKYNAPRGENVIGMLASTHRFPLTREESIHFSKIFGNASLGKRETEIGALLASAIAGDFDGDKIAIALMDSFGLTKNERAAATSLAKRSRDFMQYLPLEQLTEGVGQKGATLTEQQEASMEFIESSLKGTVGYANYLGHKILDHAKPIMAKAVREGAIDSVKATQDFAAMDMFFGDVLQQEPISSKHAREKISEGEAPEDILSTLENAQMTLFGLTKNKGSLEQHMHDLEGTGMFSKNGEGNLILKSKGIAAFNARLMSEINTAAALAGKENEDFTYGRVRRYRNPETLNWEYVWDQNGVAIPISEIGDGVFSKNQVVAKKDISQKHLLALQSGWENTYKTPIYPRRYNQAGWNQDPLARITFGDRDKDASVSMQRMEAFFQNLTGLKELQGVLHEIESGKPLTYYDPATGREFSSPNAEETPTLISPETEGAVTSAGEVATQAAQSFSGGVENATDAIDKFVAAIDKLLTAAKGEKEHPSKESGPSENSDQEEKIKARSLYDIMVEPPSGKPITVTTWGAMLTGSYYQGADKSLGNISNRWRDFVLGNPDEYNKILKELGISESSTMPDLVKDAYANADRIKELRARLAPLMGVSVEDIEGANNKGAQSTLYGTDSHGLAEMLLEFTRGGEGTKEDIAKAKSWLQSEDFSANPEDILSHIDKLPTDLRNRLYSEIQSFSLYHMLTTGGAGTELAVKNLISGSASQAHNYYRKYLSSGRGKLLGTELGFADALSFESGGYRVTAHPDALSIEDAYDEKGNLLTGKHNFVYRDFKHHAQGTLSSKDVLQGIGTLALMNNTIEAAKELKSGLTNKNAEDALKTLFSENAVNTMLRPYAKGKRGAQAKSIIEDIATSEAATSFFEVRDAFGDISTYEVNGKRIAPQDLKDLAEGRIATKELVQRLISSAKLVGKDAYADSPTGFYDRKYGADNEKFQEDLLKQLSEQNKYEERSKAMDEEFRRTQKMSFKQSALSSEMQSALLGKKIAPMVAEATKRGLLTEGGEFKDKALQQRYEDLRKEHAYVAKTEATIKGAGVPNAPGASKQRTLKDDFTGGLKQIVQRFMGYGVVMRILNKFAQSIKKVISLTRELDAVSVNIQVVTGKNAEEVRSLMKSYSDLAENLGVTTKEVATAANQWLRQGYSISDTQKLITSSTLLSKLGMTDMNTAVEVLTSTMKGFGIEAQNSMSIVDQLTALDQKFAASASEIGTALAKTAAVANNAGMSLEETEGALAVMIDVTQESAQTVGTALRSLLSRYGQVRANSFAAMSEGLDDDSAKINDIERVLNTLGIQMRSSAYDMRDIGDVLDDLYEKWGSLSDVEKGAVSTAFAGMRQRNYFLTLMDHYTEYKEAVQTASEAEGTATAKNEARLGSIEYALNKITVAWEKLTQKLNSGDFLRGTSSALAGLIENLDHVLLIVSRIAIGMNAWRIPVGMKMATQFLGFEKGVFSKDKISESWLGRGLKKQWLTQEEINQKKGMAPGTGYGEFEANTKNAAASLLNFGEVVDDVSKKMVHDAQLEGDARSENTKITENETVVKQQEQAEYVEGIKIKNQEHIAAIQVARSKTDEAYAAYRAAGADDEKTKAAYIAAKADYQKAQQAALEAQKGTSSGSDNSLVSGLVGKGAGSTGAAAAGSGILSAFMALATNSNGFSEMLGVGNFLGRLETGIDADEYNAVASEVGKYGASRWIGAGLQGAGAAIGTYIAPGIGTIIGSAAGGFVNEILGGLLQRDKVIEKVEEKRAQKSLEAIQKIGSSVDKIVSLSSKSVLTYDADDWENLNTQVANGLAAQTAGGVGAQAYSEMFLKYLPDGLAQELEAGGGDASAQTAAILNSLVKNWASLSDKERQQLLAALQGAEHYAEGVAQEPANKSAREAAYEDLRAAVKALDEAGANEEKKAAAQVDIQKARNTIKELEESEEKGKLQGALDYAAKALTDQELKGSSEDAIIYAAAKFYEENGGTAFGSTGQISENFRSKMVSLIRSDSSLNGKIGTQTPITYNELISANEKVQKMADEIEGGFAALKKLALSGKENDIALFKNAVASSIGVGFDQVTEEDLQKYRALVTSNAQTSIDAIEKTYGLKIFGNASVLGDEITDQNREVISILGNILTSVGAIGTVADLENVLSEWKSFAEKAMNKQLTSSDITTILSNEQLRNTLLLDASKKVDVEGSINRYWRFLAGNASLTSENFDATANNALYNALASQYLSQSMQDTGWWSTFVTGIGNHIEDEDLRNLIKNGNYSSMSALYTDEISKDEQDRVVNTGQLQDILKAFSSMVLETTQFMGQFKEQLKSAVTELVNLQIDLDIARLNYHKDLIEDEKESLNDLKEAISNMQSAQSQLKALESARDKLEEAKEDKQRVYREGVGWVYEANQEKVKEAMEELDAQLVNASIFEIDENIRAIDERLKDIEREIKELGREKTLIDIASKEEDLAKLQFALEGVADFEGEGSYYEKWLLAQENIKKLGDLDLKPDLPDQENPSEPGPTTTEQWENTIANGVAKALAKNQWKDTLEEKAQDVSNAYADWLTLKEADGEGIVSSEQIEAYRNYLNTLDQYSAYKGKAEQSGLGFDSNYFSGLNKAYEGLGGPKSLPGGKTAVSNGNIPKDWEYQIYKDFFGQDIADLLFSHEYSKEQREQLWAALKNWDAYDNIFNVSALKSFVFSNKDLQGRDILREADGLGFETAEATAALNWWRQNQSQLTPYELVRFPDFLYEFVYASGWDQFWREIGEWFTAIGMGSESDFVNTASKSIDGFAKRFFGQNSTQAPSGIGKVVSHGRVGHASGLLSTLRPEQAVINELGTEGIITPQGTITALPSKTGIVPADITKNLWQLGEIAPTLVKEAYAPKVLESAASQTYDNSMNFQNFYQTIEAKDGFDMEEFLRQARQYVAITKNQRHT